MKNWIALTIALSLLLCLSGCQKQGPDLPGNAPSEELIARYAGDWNGLVVFEECSEKYYDRLEGEKTGAIARFVIDEYGNITPFIGLHVEDTPIENLTATFDLNNGTILLSGAWINIPFRDIVLSEEDGLLRLDLPLSGEEGSLKLIFRLRRLNDPNWSTDEPYLSPSNVEYCYGKSFDELAAINGYTKGDYPDSPDTIYADGGTAPLIDPTGDQLLGSWEAADMAGAIYQFDPDGRGAYIYGEMILPFSYTDTGTAVSILFDGNTYPSEYPYEIRGNSLLIEDSFGSTVEYIKTE